MSSNPAIRVERLGKRYQIGTKEAVYETLRDTLVGVGRRLNPFAWGRLRHATQAIDLWALRNVAFQVHKGEAVGIIGRNGAGKSTLLKILSRITPPTEGRVELFGRVGSLLEVGTGFHPELTGRENIFLNGAILGMRRDEIRRRFDEIVSFAEVERFIDTPVKRYSSGMYLRLAFGVAAHLETEILLVDEVLAVGDAAFQRKCLGKMGDVARTGRTVLFVSHNLTAIKSLCSKAVWLDKGTVVGEGEPGQVVADYLQTGMGSVLKQVWPDAGTAPGNEKIRMRSAEVSPQDGQSDGQLTVETALLLEFEFWNYIADTVLNFAVSLFTIEGIYVLAAVSSAKNRGAGLLRETVRIPPNFLNDGIYTVRVQVVEDSSKTSFVHSDILVFEVNDIPRAAGWFGKWPGVVRPTLEWSSQDFQSADA